MSWRDTTPPAVQDDLDGLVEEAVQAAQHLLAKNGEFFPFGLTVTEDGQRVMAAADPGLGSRPPSQAVLDSLYEGVRADAGQRRAAAFVADVRAGGADAIRVEVEHRDGGPALEVLVPYAWKGLRRKNLALGEPSAAKGTRHVYTDQA